MIEFITEYWISIAGATIGLIFLYLEYKANIWMWAASIFMAAFYIVIFYTTQLYASMGIYIYFLLASIYGWIVWLWKRKETQTKDDIILRMGRKMTIPISVAILMVFGIIYLILRQWSDNSIQISIGDALTTSLNIVALWMVSRKWAEQWLLIIPANLISALLLVVQNDYISGIMFLIFFVVSIFGYFKWKKLAEQSLLKVKSNS